MCHVLGKQVVFSANLRSGYCSQESKVWVGSTEGRIFFPRLPGRGTALQLAPEPLARPRCWQGSPAGNFEAGRPELKRHRALFFSLHHLPPGSEIPAKPLAKKISKQSALFFWCCGSVIIPQPLATAPADVDPGGQQVGDPDGALSSRPWSPAAPFMVDM